MFPGTVSGLVAGRPLGGPTSPSHGPLTHLLPPPAHLWDQAPLRCPAQGLVTGESHPSPFLTYLPLLTTPPVSPSLTRSHHKPHPGEGPAEHLAPYSECWSATCVPSSSASLASLTSVQVVTIFRHSREASSCARITALPSMLKPH